MLIVIDTQIHENYGDADQPYWKAKGGQSIKVTNVPLGLDSESIDALVQTVEIANDYYTEYVLGWSIQPDDYLSWFEKSQLEYDGCIQCPEPVVDYSDLVNNILETV